MRFTYDLNTSDCLILYAANEDRHAIAQMVKDHGCDFCGQCEHDALEPLICNSDLEWIQPKEIGALTSAPILGFRGEEAELPADVNPSYVRVTSHIDGKTFHEPVTAAWAFMDYQLRSFLKELRDKGRAVFVS